MSSSPSPDLPGRIISSSGRAGVLGALSESFDIRGLPPLPSNHFSLAEVKRYETGSPDEGVVYFTEMYNIFSDLTDQIDQAGLTDEQRERETEAKLGELRALSIVADD
ncbi:Bridging integrator 3 [Liparis tanakae]|uniref:Bridging integrator 3 n=1 Tax=Liparis tanakae TaxID=230148 RepID=A0A4Z2GBK6_9TELE|nr:Bridging integrator 3 [Liparis tanakae]